MIKMKNLLAENMVRFRTKNLSEQELNTMVDRDINYAAPGWYHPQSGLHLDRPTDAFGNKYDSGNAQVTDAYNKLEAMQKKIDELLKNVKLEVKRKKDDLAKPGININLAAEEILKNVLYKTYGLEDQIIEMQRLFPQLAINGSHEILDTLTRIVQDIIDYPDGSSRYGNHIAKLAFVNYEKK